MPNSIASQPFSLYSFQTFGELLKYLRRREHLTQLELSIIVGYSEAQIGRLEKNQRRPDLTVLKALFLPALRLDQDPELAQRFLELAESGRQEDVPTPGIAPYKGLLYFDETDANVFFGRETLTAHLVARVIGLALDASARLLAVVGASGSGKSSLLRAGLAVALRRSGWNVQIFTPGTNPLKELEMHLDSDRDMVGSTRVLVLVDQFEEVFTLCRTESERAGFIEKLLALAQDSSRATTVVLALRADFYSHCAQYPRLRQAVATEQEYIGQMSTEELRRAIEEPAQQGGWQFEPGLVDILLQDVGAHGSSEPEPGALPLLSHALLATWENRRARTFTREGYHASGGVRGAIAETAESVFTDQLNREQQELAKDVFLRLTELGEGTEDTRRRAALNELVRQSKEATQLRAVLNTLADARLITLNEDSAEVAHEALIREWQRLHEWLTQDRDGLRLHRHLTESAREWETRGRDASELYRGARLAQAREWTDANKDSLNEMENAFLTASIEQEEQDALEREALRHRELEVAKEIADTKTRSEARLRGRNRVISAVGALAILLAILAGIFAVQSNVSSSLANQQRQAALNAQATAQSESTIRATQQAIADAQHLAAEANALLNANGSSEQIALLSLRSMNSQYSPQADAALAGAAYLNYPQQIFSGHTDAIANMDFSPDGKTIVTSSIDQTVRLWDVQTGQQIYQLDDPEILYDTENLVAKISPDGRHVLTVRTLGPIDNYSIGTLWNIETGEKDRSFTPFKMLINAAVFSQEGTYLYLGFSQGRVKFLNFETGELEFRITIPSQAILRISSEGRYAIVQSTDDPGTLQAWDLTAVPPVKVQDFVYSAGVKGIPNYVAFSPDNQQLLIGYVDGVALLWEFSTGKMAQTFIGHGSEVRSVAFSPDGEYVVTGSLDRTARLWHVQTGEEILRFPHSKSLVAVAFSPDGKSILTGSVDGTMQLWTIHPHPALPIYRDAIERANLSGVAFSPDGKWIATGGTNGLRVWDVDTGKLQQSFANAGLIRYGVRYSPDGLYLLSGDWLSGVASLWDVQSGKRLQQYIHPFEIAGNSIFLNDVAFSSGGKWIAASPEGIYVRIWDQSTADLSEFILMQDSSTEIARLAFSPDDHYIMTVTTTGIVSLHDVELGTLARKINAGVGLNGAAFSPDGKTIATAGVNKLSILWDLETGLEIRQFVGHTDALYSVVFSQDGKLLATASADGTARLWDVTSGEELRRFVGHTAAVTNLAFSPDNQFLATVSSDGTAKLWDIDYHTTMQYLCSILLRDFTAEERVQYGIPDDRPTCP